MVGLEKSRLCHLHPPPCCKMLTCFVTCFGHLDSFVVDQHIKLCLLLWFEFFRTIALLLGALRDLIVGYSKLSSASVKCRREIFGRTNFHLRVVSVGVNVSSVLRDDKRRTGEGTEQCRQTERTPRHYSLDFSTSISSFTLTCKSEIFCLQLYLLCVQVLPQDVVLAADSDED